MTDTREPDQTYPRTDQFEDEVELIDYLRVIWKWKRLIPLAENGENKP